MPRIQRKLVQHYVQPLCCACIQILALPNSTVLSFHRVRVPRGIAMVITSLQLIQMVVGCLVNVWAYQVSPNACFITKLHEAKLRAHPIIPYIALHI